MGGDEIAVQESRDKEMRKQRSGKERRKINNEKYSHAWP